MINILAQIISIFAAAFNIFSYQMKDNRRLFLSKGISGALFAVNFIMLGNFTAGALNAVNLLRGAVLAGVLTLVVWWTYDSPQLPVFVDPVTQQRGIEE